MPAIAGDLLPGNTDLSSYVKPEPAITPLSLSIDGRRVIVLATNDVTNTSLFLNGLTQNIVILYDLFESMGYRCYLLQYTQGSTDDKKAFISTYRTITPAEIVRNSLPIRAFIEIGMSLDATTRAYLRSIGAKIVKLYLGNILNIDVETIQYTKGLFFNHHIVGEIDEVWVSPHYKQHVDYAAVLNRCSLEQGKVVPYVWDPCFINHYGAREEIEWRAAEDWRDVNFVIMDANISFQKCSFFPILLAEAFYRAHPEWRGRVVVINGDKFKLSAHVNNNILPTLSLWNAGRIVMEGRKNLHTILRENRSACFLTHQWNNDFNYMTFELFYCNYPILHNSEGWDKFGYHYSLDRWDEAVEMLFKAITTHKDNLNIYRTHAANLLWTHSIHNPAVQADWRALL